MRSHRARLPDYFPQTQAAVYGRPQRMLDHKPDSVARNMGAMERRENHNGPDLGRDVEERCVDVVFYACFRFVLMVFFCRRRLVDDSLGYLSPGIYCMIG